MNINEFTKSLLNVRRNTNNGSRAPHKLFILLIILSNYFKDGPRQIPFNEFIDIFTLLHENYCPPQLNNSVHYPFIRLRTDSIYWEIENENLLHINNGDASITQLKKLNPLAGFSEEIYTNLIYNKKDILNIITKILKEHFPESYYADIFETLGINTSTCIITANRDPLFRKKILEAYEYKCAICGLDLRLENQLIAIEAAHVKWHSAGGPDTEPNGLALCSLHHKFFDRGVFTINDSGILSVSQKCNGNSQQLHSLLFKYHSTKIRNPQSTDYYLEKEFLDWHKDQVFFGPAKKVS